jgi:hypothetical protein
LDPRTAALALLGRTLLWLVPCLALWYAAAGPLAWIPGKVASPFVGAAVGEVNAMTLRGRGIVYTVSVEPPYELMRRGTGAATADVEVPSATYTYGIGLFLALCLASHNWRRPKVMLIGAAIVWISSTWGIGFDAVRQLATSADLAAHLAFGPAAMTAIAFGYQVGSLLLPTLLPIALWLAFNPQVWRKVD